MKWFLSICTLAGIVAVMSSSSCGPKRDFCPTNTPEYVCFDKDGGGMGGAGGIDQGPCDGASQIVCPDPAQTKVCKQSDCP
jgi:hypothetical protein